VKSWHRFYDPATGRYISADPIGLEGGINLYGYALQNPIYWIDPWGLSDCTISGEWVSAEIVNLSVKHTGNTWDFWIDLVPPGVYQGHANFLVNADAHFVINCKKVCECEEENEEWTIDETLYLPQLHVKIPVPLWSLPWGWIYSTSEAARKATKYYR
jgi:hypothetical protein